jgi:hypothetical protein
VNGPKTSGSIAESGAKFLGRLEEDKSRGGF